MINVSRDPLRYRWGWADSPDPQGEESDYWLSDKEFEWSSQISSGCGHKALDLILMLGAIFCAPRLVEMFDSFDQQDVGSCLGEKAADEDKDG